MSQKTYDIIIERGKSPINDAIIDFLKTKIKGSYLDIGANTGWLLREVPGGVGIDNSPLMIYGAKDCKMILADAEHIPFHNNAFDMAVMSCVLEQCADWHKALAEARRVARKVIGINPYPGSPWGVEGGWVKSIIDPSNFPYVEQFDKDRYYFEI